MTLKPLRIIYMGTPDFALPALRAIYKSAYNVTAVFTQPPRPKGRGHKVQKSPVHLYADDKKIAVYTPNTLKKSPGLDEFLNVAQDADIAIVAAYGLILPKVVLDAPKYGCINIHGSLLPRWRGASPIQQAIWQGDQKSGVTIMQMEEGLDTGPMILKDEIPITLETTATYLHDDLAEMGAGLMLRTLDTLARYGALESIVQDNALSTYAPLLKKEDGGIHWDHPAEAIDRQIRALNPWPGTYTYFEEQRLRIKSATLSTQISADIDAPAGTIVNKEGDIMCGNNTALRLHMVQPDNAKVMDFGSAFNGGYIKIGARAVNAADYTET